ncbi:MAG TPA: glutaminyl-peptide cyclotransferase [Methanothrix sp.]|jgi:glutamine cyclotransferase|nr:glutaminyl-peptide cyclotransferase [Methanothrix sp.]
MDLFDSMPKTIPRIKKACSTRFVRLALPAFLLLAAIAFAVQGSSHSVEAGATSVFGYQVVNAYPHNSTAFTQGLVYDEGVLYEGTGLYGRSTLRHVDLITGRVLEQTRLENDLFGEGVALWKDRIIQLTWQSGLGLVYGKENLTEISNFSYHTEGWGITSDNKSLIMSDGTDILHILDPETFAETGQINVTANGIPFKGLNELEYIKGNIYANIWPTSWIAIISPETGEVKGKINLQGILQENDTLGHKVDVLNGIAYDEREDRLFVTGKLWPKLFEIKLVPEVGSD